MRNTNIPMQINDSPIGNLDHLGFQRYLPHPYLRPWVQCYWVIQAELTAKGFTENLYPDGGTTLFVSFDSNREAQLYFNATQIYSKIHIANTVDRMGVRFHPGGAFQLLGIEMPDVLGGQFSPTQLGLVRLLDLQDALSNIHLTNHRVNTIDQWLLDQAAQLNARQGIIQQLLPWLLYSTEPMSVVNENLAISRRQIERKFRQEIGLTPAYVKQLHRIKNSRRMISEQPSRTLTDVALASGFYDQAHFIRQFQKLTGQTPGQYRNKKMSQIYNRQQ